MHIEHLADNLSTIPMVAAWNQAPFTAQFTDTAMVTPVILMRQRVKKLTETAQKGALPVSFVALDDDMPVGSVSLLAYTPTHPHLSPLLADLYVEPQHRNKGIGSALVRHAVRQAALLGVEKLHVFTTDAESFYRRLGWEIFNHTTDRGQRYTMMSINSGH